MIKRYLLIIFVLLMSNTIELQAQDLTLQQTKDLLSGNKWLLRRFELDGQMYSVPKDLQGLKRVFLSNGMSYSYLPSDEKSEAEQHKWSITKTHITFYMYDMQQVYAYRLEDFAGYSLYLDYEDDDEFPTFVFDIAEKIEPTTKTKTVSERNPVTIGSQVWSSENLNTETFRNGDLIMEATTNEQWVQYGKQGIPAWCYANFDPENQWIYGKLYNFYAVLDPRGLAPKGWHIPSLEEAHSLIDYLGGIEVASISLKSQLHWDNRYKGTNESGFNAKPGGFIWDSGDFGYFEKNCDFWTSHHEPFADGLKGFYISISASIQKVGHRNIGNYGSGCSVRLVKD